jgi:cellulose synthase/poly-beta-1,6-N-acetylglucosamine synthase-like glycosyltransferase
MMLVSGFLFATASALVFHTYVLFPAHMKRLARKPPKHWDELEAFPTVAVLLAAYNEAEMIEAKITSLFKTNYPKHKIEVWVGSDASTDGTDEIVQKLVSSYPQLHFERFEARSGKPTIINALATRTQAEILIVTDADALFDEKTLPELIHPFVDPQVGGVQANARIRTIEGSEVARQEASYTLREMEIKSGEGKWGVVIGGFGAAYALRRELFRPVPPGFIVDDFYTFADISRQGFQTVFQSGAMTTLSVSADGQVQFRRKRRIGKGNFQNLRHFSDLLTPFSKLSYVFWSHKALRWLTPFLISVAYAAAAWGSNESYLLALAFYGMTTCFLLALADVPLRRLGISIKPLRFLSHFLRMNWALVLGFIDSLGGDKKVSWDNQHP